MHFSRSQLVRLNLLLFIFSVLFLYIFAVVFFALSGCHYSPDCEPTPIVKEIVAFSGVATLIIFLSGNAIARIGFLKFFGTAVFMFFFIFLIAFIKDRYHKPRIMKISFCSDVCPEFTRKITIYEGVKTPEECEQLGGLIVRDIAWGGYIGCGPKGVLFWMSEAWR